MAVGRIELDVECYELLQEDKSNHTNWCRILLEGAYGNDAQFTGVASRGRAKNIKFTKDFLLTAKCKDCTFVNIFFFFSCPEII